MRYKVEEIETLTTIHLVEAKSAAHALKRMIDNDGNAGTYICIDDQYKKSNYSILRKVTS